jgi:Tfp pilus assembly protein PilF
MAILRLICVGVVSDMTWFSHRSNFLPLLSACVLCLSLQSISVSAAECFSGSASSRIEGCSRIIDDSSASAQQKFDARLVRGQAYHWTGRTAEALAELNHVLSEKPNHSFALNTRAWIYFRSNQGELGLPDVERALKLDPFNGGIWDTRAHIRQSKGNFAGAFQDYETAVGFGGKRIVRKYQCGLREKHLYSGPISGLYSAETREALRICSLRKDCDPLPRNELAEQCDGATS